MLTTELLGHSRVTSWSWQTCNWNNLSELDEDGDEEDVDWHEMRSVRKGRKIEKERKRIECTKHVMSWRTIVSPKSHHKTRYDYDDEDERGRIFLPMKRERENFSPKEKGGMETREKDSFTTATRVWMPRRKTFSLLSPLSEFLQLSIFSPSPLSLFSLSLSSSGNS